MKEYLLLFLVVLCWPTHADNMKTNKNDVTFWYDAFSKKDPKLLDKILSETWVDSPSAPSQPPGPARAKQILAELTTTFPDLRVTFQDVLQHGNTVVVRSEIS